MELLSINQKCYIIKKPPKTGIYLGIVRAINNSQYIIEVFLKDNYSEIKRFDIRSGKEIGQNANFKISVRKYIEPTAASSIQIVKKELTFQLPPLPKYEQTNKNIEPIVKKETETKSEPSEPIVKKETVKETPKKQKKPRKKRTTKKKAAETITTETE